MQLLSYTPIQYTQRLKYCSYLTFQQRLCFYSLKGWNYAFCWCGLSVSVHLHFIFLIIQCPYSNYIIACMALKGLCSLAICSSLKKSSIETEADPIWFDLSHFCQPLFSILFKCPSVSKSMTPEGQVDVVSCRGWSRALWREPDDWARNHNLDRKGLPWCVGFFGLTEID